jgi:hypothetical protein
MGEQVDDDVEKKERECAAEENDADGPENIPL